MQIEVKRYLEALYGLGIESVQTINYEGKKEYVRKNNMERINKFQRRADWKKVGGFMHDAPKILTAPRAGQCQLLRQ